jgi:alpha-tubulin suppressor-like RCC1 family protein
MTRHNAQPAAINGYAWGYNNAGGLGIGNVARALRPVPVHLPKGTIDVQGGTDFAAALTSAGQVWTWGGNGHGQLGDATTTAVRFAPARVELPNSARVSAIAVGQDYVLALTRHGGIYAWGRNQHGQLGDTTTSGRRTPVHVSVPGAVVQVAAGNAASAAITTAGAVLTWGRASATHVLAGANAADLATPRVLALPAGVTAAMVDAGQRHLVVLSRHGKMLTFGVGPGGKPLPDSMPTDPAWGQVVSISAGDNHTVALTDTGTVLAWGANNHGQLGTRDTTNRETPVRVRIPKQHGHVVQVIAGGDSVLARTSEQQVYAWGHGGFGQNGTGDTADHTRPHPVHIPHPPEHAGVTGVHTGRYHNLAITNQP